MANVPPVIRLSADDYRKEVREATIEYLRRYTDVDERKAVVKEALSEWLNEQLAKFGWLSAKTLAGLIIVVVLYLWLSFNGWHK